MKKINKLIACLLVLSITASFLTGCGKKENSTEQAKDQYQIYYINRSDTKVVPQEYELQNETGNVKDILNELMNQLAEQPESKELHATLQSDLKKVECLIDEKQVIINFDESYNNLDPIKEILVRAAIVRTVTQIPEIEYVTMQVNSRPLSDASGSLVGVMTADMFVDNAGTEINSYERVKLKLYFANETGDRLRQVNYNVVYNSNISLEKLVVEQLIKGPVNEEAYPTLNPESKIVSITTKDSICYVNLNEAFLTQTTNASAAVTLYSLVNSLVELSNINKVQIMINGDNSMVYRDAIPLSTVLERNLEIIE